MYRQNPTTPTTIKTNTSYQGEPLEAKLRKMLNNKEPIGQNDTSPLLFTERNEGVIAGYDIRTDRWEIAIDATDALTKQHQAKRQERHKISPPADPNTSQQAIQGMAKES